MRTFIQGIAIGSLVTAAALCGYAYGTNSDNQLEVRPGKSLDELEAAGMCQVQVGYGRITAGDSCFSGEVMTGTRAGYILCADIRVTCNQ